MTAERWQKVREVLYEALQLPPEQRPAFLERACSTDHSLRREVESLLASSEEARSSFLEPTPAPRVTLAKGTRVDEYEIEALAGSGGMGDVYRARDLRLGKDVAIKVLPASVSADRDRLRRFEQEARAAAALDHPNILAVYRLGTYQGAPYMVSELLEGETLRERLRSGALPMRQAIDCGVQVASGLEAAHRKGIVHRDLKPENLFLIAHGRVKILDFGLAKLRQSVSPEPSPQGAQGRGWPAGLREGLAPTDGPRASIHPEHVTRPGVIMGTAGYMSPEQVRGQATDERSDIFAFGAILYEILSGKRAFQGSTTADTMSAVLNDEPPSLAQVVTSIPPTLERVVHRCLQKKAEQRFQTALDVGLALEAVAPGFSPASGDAAFSPASENAALKGGATGSDSQAIAGLVKRHKKAIIALAAAGLVIAAALIYALYRASWLASAPPAGSEMTRLTGSGDVLRADISPDGKYVAYTRSTAGKQSLWLKQLATDKDAQIASLGEDYCPGLAFSPDGSYVYYVRKEPLKPSGDLYQVALLGGVPRKMLAGIAGPPAFSPDGQRMAFVRGSIDEGRLLTVSLHGSGERVLASYRAPEIWLGRVAWSPDGKTLAFARYPQWILTTIGAEGGPAQPVGGRWNSITDLTWLPGSRHLVVAGIPQGEPGSVTTSQLYEVSVDGGETRQITHDLSRYLGVRASPDGKTLLAIQHQQLTTIQIATPGKWSEARSLSAENQSYDGQSGLAWTPDGKIVYSSDRNGRADLWEMGGGGSNPQRLTSNDASSVSAYPAVSLRGGFIAFVQWENGQGNIWLMDMDGRNLKQLTQGENDQYPAVSPDGQWVVFMRGESGKTVLMKVASEGGPAVQLTDYNSGWPSVSPDGKWIACWYFPGENPPFSLAIVPFAGGQPTKVFPRPATAKNESLLWTPDGRAISFLNIVSGVWNIWEQPVAGGPPKPVTHFTSDSVYYFAWSRDGPLALSRSTLQMDAVLIKNFQ